MQRGMSPMGGMPRPRGQAPPLYGGGQRGGFGQMMPQGMPGRMAPPNPMAMRRQGIGIGPGGGRPPMPGGISRPEGLNRRFNPGMMNRPGGGDWDQEGLNRMGPHGMSGESPERQPFQELLDWLNGGEQGHMMRSGNPQAPYDQPQGGGASPGLPAGRGQPMPPGGMGRPSRPLYSPPGGGRPPMNRQFSQPTPGGGAPYDFGQFAGGGGQSPLYQPQFGGMPPMPRGY